MSWETNDRRYVPAFGKLAYDRIPYHAGRRTLTPVSIHFGKQMKHAHTHTHIISRFAKLTALIVMPSQHWQTMIYLPQCLLENQKPSLTKAWIWLCQQSWVRRTVLSMNSGYMWVSQTIELNVVCLVGIPSTIFVRQCLTPMLGCEAHPFTNMFLRRSQLQISWAACHVVLARLIHAELGCIKVPADVENSTGNITNIITGHPITMIQ